MTPFIEKMAGRAARAPKRIAFPEAENPDILRTAQLAAEQGMGRPVLLAELGSRLYALEGVDNYRFSAPAADLARCGGWRGNTAPPFQTFPKRPCCERQRIRCGAGCFC